MRYINATVRSIPSTRLQAKQSRSASERFIQANPILMLRTTCRLEPPLHFTLQNSSGMLPLPHTNKISAELRWERYAERLYGVISSESFSLISTFSSLAVEPVSTRSSSPSSESRYWPVTFHPV